MLNGSTKAAQLLTTTENARESRSALRPWAKQTEKELYLVPLAKIPYIFDQMKPFGNGKVVDIKDPDSDSTWIIISILDPMTNDQVLYVIDPQILGRGAFGTVHKAQNLKTGEIVADKVCNKIDDITIVQDVIHERKNLKQCGQLIGEAEDTKGYPHTLMMYFPGVSLLEVLYEINKESPLDSPERFSRKRTLDILQQAQLFSQIIRLVLNLHNETHLIHRDLKADNFKAKCTESEVAAYLMDFGTAYATSSSGSEPDDISSIVGTPGYVAPEMNSYPKRTKWEIPQEYFALGVVLAEICCETNYQVNLLSILEKIKAEGHLRAFTYEEFQTALLHEFTEDALEDPFTTKEIKPTISLLKQAMHHIISGLTKKNPAARSTVQILEERLKRLNTLINILLFKERTESRYCQSPAQNKNSKDQESMKGKEKVVEKKSVRIQEELVQNEEKSQRRKSLEIGSAVSLVEASEIASLQANLNKGRHQRGLSCDIQKLSTDRIQPETDSADLLSQTMVGLTFREPVRGRSPRSAGAMSPRMISPRMMSPRVMSPRMGPASLGVNRSTLTRNDSDNPEVVPAQNKKEEKEKITP